MGASSNHDDNAVDDLVCAAMKTLDAEVPSGYFEDLPNRTLARLEGISSMQSTSESSGNAIPVASNMAASAPSTPPTTAEKPARDEDSGLHDIRNLASSARMRLSSRRIGTNPPPVDEDVAASGSWKAVALPEPAKMVSLPELETLPSKADIKAQLKAEKVAAKARKSRPSGELAPVVAAVEAVPAAASMPSLSAAAATSTVAEAPLHLDDDIPSLATGSAKGAVVPAMPMIGSRIAGANAQKKSRAALYGALGVGLAAAAGAIIYVQTQKGASSSADQEMAPDRSAMGAAAESTPTPAPAAEPAKPTVETIAANADDEGADKGKADDAAAAAPAPEDLPAAVPEAKPVKKAPRHAVRKPQKHVIEVKDPGNGIAPPKKKEEKPEPAAKDGNEPSESFDDLLKEAGYQKVEQKKKLAKKSLTGSDFKTGMDAIREKARACYNGTQGLANIKLTIAPSGKVAKIAVTGPFAGTPVASCVTAAVRGATFPAWDGGPQSFRYSFLLSE